MKTFKALGALVAYPEAEMIAAIGEIADAVEREGLLGRAERKSLDALFDHLRTSDLVKLQEDYVALFDRSRRFSLHLYEHLYADSRERGQAMADLVMVYRLNGFEIDARELPDYLPMLCEFLSLVPLKPAQAILADAVTVLEALRDRLAKRDNPYGAALGALVSLAGSKADPELLAGLAAAAAPEEESLAALDEAWAEAPVTFGPESPPEGCNAAPAPRRTPDSRGDAP